MLNPTGTICKIGEGNGPQKVLLLGNSHADSIKAAFSQSMSARGVQSHFFVSNNPLMTGGRDANTILTDIRNGGITHVVLHYSPDIYAKPDIVAEIERLTSALNEAGVPVHLIAPVPVYAHHIPTELYKTTVAGISELRPQDADDYLAANKPFFDFASARSVSVQGLFLPHELLCPTGSACLVQVDGFPLYFDRGHLTLTGAGRLRPLFDRIAAEIADSAS